MRMSRRMGLVRSYVMPSLYEFWAGATVISVSGGSSSTATLRNGIPIGDTDTPVYVLMSKGDSVNIKKFKNGVWAEPFVSTFLFMQAGLYEITAYGDNKSTYGSTIYLTTANGGWSEPDPLYGYVVVALRFPSFSEAVTDKMIDKHLPRADVPDTNAYHYGSSVSTCYIADGDLSSDPNDVYLQLGCTTSAGYFSVTRGGTPGAALVSGPGSGVYWRHASSAYYLRSGVSSTSNASTRAGGIYRLHT